MNDKLDRFINYMGNVRKLSDNTVESYSRDLRQYIEYIKSKNIASFKNTNKTTIITYLLYMQKNGRATSTISEIWHPSGLTSTWPERIITGPDVGLRVLKVEKKLPVILSSKEGAVARAA